MKVILVDEKDNQIGVKEKLEVHKAGDLHRAFSVFIFNSKNELLMQKRSNNKYHSADKWTNTCCSHPLPGEDLKQSAINRLNKEMGVYCDIEEKFSFIYKAEFENGLFEHEYDHVFVGYCDKNPNPNVDEVSEWKWISLNSLKKDIEKNPDDYTPWLKIALVRPLS